MNTESIVRRAVVAFVVFAVSSFAAAESNGVGQAHGIEGTWQVRITPQDCDTGVPFPQFAFDSLFTFASGGTLTETTANPTFQPGQRSPGAGYWVRNGRSSYEAVFQAFVQFAGGGYTRGNQRVEQDIELLDADNWNATLAVAFTDPAGAPIANGCANTVGKRLS